MSTVQRVRVHVKQEVWELATKGPSVWRLMNLCSRGATTRQRVTCTVSSTQNHRALGCRQSHFSEKIQDPYTGWKISEARCVRTAHCVRP